MRRPAMLMQVRIGGWERGVLLWLPLFLLLPLAIVLLIILSPLILVTITILKVRGRGGQLWPVIGALCSVRCIRAAYDVLCSAPGLRVAVSNRDERLYISVI